MLRTRFTDLTGCKIPIQQAAIGGLARPQLATAVSAAGGLGMIYAGSFDPPQMIEVFEDMRHRTSGVFGANFLIPEAFVPDLSEIREQVETASKLVKVVEFFYRQPDPSLVDLVHKGGALASWQVGSNEEAVAAAEAGCDIIVAQGVEAGGHVRGKVSLLTLLSQVLDSVKVPVLAAGGIGSGRALAAVLAAGASGARVGTRFIAASEAGAHPEYVKALIASEPEDTVVTEAFSEGWPNAPHRVLRFCIEEAQNFKGDVVGHKRLISTGEMVPVKPLESFTMTSETTGNLKAMPHWAGESVSGVKIVKPVAAIMKELVDEAETLLLHWTKHVPTPKAVVSDLQSLGKT